MKMAMKQILQLSVDAVENADNSQWDKCLHLIQKRDILIQKFFSREFNESEKKEIEDFIFQIQNHDQNLKHLATNSKEKLSGQITHLALSQKASRKYQQIASQ